MLDGNSDSSKEPVQQLLLLTDSNKLEHSGGSCIMNLLLLDKFPHYLWLNLPAISFNRF